mgnify:FL=1
MADAALRFAEEREQNHHAKPYLQWRAPKNIWTELEEQYFGPLVPDWFRTDAVWFPGCLGDTEGDITVSESNIANFMASQHWSVVSMGTTGSGMFLHSDSIDTSTYHLQLSGRKKWFVCPPQGQEVTYGVRLFQKA